MTPPPSTDDLHISKSWIPWLLFAAAVIGGIVGLIRYADGKVSRTEVEQIVDQRLAPFMVMIQNIKETVTRIETKLDSKQKD